MNFRVRGVKYTLEGVLLILPLSLLLLAVIAYPVCNLVFTSFFSWNGIKGAPYEFAGLQNYIEFFSHHQTPTVFTNMLILVVTGIFGTIPIAFFLATVVNKSFRGLRLFRLCYFLPVVINRVAVCLMFIFILFPRTGPFALMLRWLEFPSTISMLGNPKTAMWTVAFVNMWTSVGFQMVVFSAGLAAIPNEIYEAATMDGVSTYQKFRFITLPMMQSTIKVVAVFVLTGAFKVFDVVKALTDGGPAGATEVLNTILYRNAFTFNRYGLASANGVVILLVCVGLSLGINALFRKRD